jgi:hypothetical protein
MIAAPPLRIAIVALVVLLGMARPSSAGLIDFIMEFSGPSMLGLLPLHCRIDSTSDTPECRLSEWRMSGTTPDRNWWLQLEGGYYGSTRLHTSHSYGAFEVNMLSFDPVIESEWRPFGDGIRLHHGIGLSYNFFFGDDFKRFDRLGTKIRWISVDIGWVNVAYNMRIYPNQFTSGDFGKLPPDTSTDPAKKEIVHGFVIGLHIFGGRD